MEKIIDFFIRYKVWNGVLLIGVLFFGFIFLSGIKFSFFPQLPSNFVSIQVVYPGASPEEVEEGVILKIEENLDGLEGIERVTSVSRENIGTVSVEMETDYDMDELLTEVKNAVDRINSFPVGAEKPVVFEVKPRDRAITIVMFGESDLYTLKYIADEFRDQLLATEEISQVEFQGLPNLEFSIELSEADLRRYQLSFSDIAQAVSAANTNISGGKFETLEEEILIRAYGKKYYAKELGNLVVRAGEDGQTVYLRDVADIKEQWEDTPDQSYYNDRPAIILNVDKTESEDILAIVAKVRELIDVFNSENSTVEVKVLDDRTIGLQQRINLLISNGTIGLLFVIGILGFFLNLRLSFWVSIGIPFSFAGMFIIASFAGLTINVISTFGMILVVGILVDDAIVVAENIYAHYERGKSAYRAALDGAAEMVAPVSTSVVTTMIAFSPFFFLDGFLGKFIWHMATVVIAALFFSLIESFLILPGHLAHSKGLHPHKEDSLLRQKLESAINWFTHQAYGPTLRFAMKHKWAVVVSPISLFFVTVGLLASGLIGATFFPFIDGDTVPVNISLVAGQQEKDTNQLLSKIETKVWELNDELKAEREDGKDVILGVQRDIGSNELGESGSHTGKLTIQLLDGEIRNLESYVIANRLRERVGPTPEAQSISYGRTSLFGKPVSVSLLGNDLSQLTKAKTLLLRELENLPSLKDVTESDKEGRRELDISLKPQAYALGLSLRDVANQVRQGFFGQEVQRIQRGKDEIRVWVRYKESDRLALGFLDQMRIRTPDGREFPFTELADYKIDRGLVAINHLNKKREVKVEANLADTEADLPPILANIQENIVPRVLSQVTGVQATYEGQSRDQAKTNSSMAVAFPMALIAMFILVVLVFRSVSQAVIIFALIPFGIMGAIWGHGIQNIQVNILSIYGFIALSGIIINDSIVFVDQINRNLREGQFIEDAIYNAGTARLRPILLTTLTTVFGLAPIILETSRQAQFLIPMAVSVAYGLLFGTFIILVVLPASVLVLNRLRLYVGRISNKGLSPELVEPAIREIKELESMDSQPHLEPVLAKDKK